MMEIERLRQLKETRHRRQSTDEPDSPLSEKAKGKLPETSLSRVSSNSSISPNPHRQASISSISSTSSLPGAKNGFIPTDDWVRHHLIFYTLY